MGLLQSMFKNEKEPSLLVFNTLSWNRSGLATVYIDHQIVPRGKKAGIYDKDGKRLASQAVSSRSDGTYWAVWFNDIPAFGYKKYLIIPEDETAMTIPSHADDILENKWYRIMTDNTRGTVKSLYDKELSLELVDQDAQYEMGEFILEQLGNRSQMESKMLNDFKRSPLDTVWFDSVTTGEIMEQHQVLR